MRRAAIAGAAIVGLALIAPGGATAATRSCAERGSHTERENSVARVYVTRDGDLIACSKRTGRRLFVAGPEDRYWQLRLRGHWLAFANEICVDALGDDCTYGVDLVNVTRSAFVFGAGGYVPRVELKRNGSLAWSEDEGPRGAIYKREAGRVRRLDRGAGVHPGTLRLSGSTLRWAHGQQRRTATLR